MWKQQYITWDYVRKKGNQYAQYALGKLYLCGRDVSRDREKAVEYLTASAEQGNLYASFYWNIWMHIRIRPCFWQQPDCFIIWKSCFAKKYRDQWK